jgi:hypothetical protein
MTDDPFTPYAEAEAQLAQAIGLFSMRFATLERHLNWATGILSGTTEDRGRVLMAAIRNVSTRLDVFSALVVGLKIEANVRQRLKECAKEIGRLNAYRNIVLHNDWTGRSGPPERWNKVWTVTGRDGARYKQQDFTPESIKAEAMNCLLCVIRLADGMKAHETGRPLEKP